MSGRQTNIPARRVSSGTTSERNEEITDPSYGHIRYNTDEHYLEIYHRNSWKDLITNNRETVDISGIISGTDASLVYINVADCSVTNVLDISNHLLVRGDVSFNSKMIVVDASFLNDIYIGKDVIVEGDISVNTSISVLDASFQNDVDIHHMLTVMGDVSFNKYLDARDGSFHNAVDIYGKLTVVDDVSLNKFLSVKDASFQNDVDIHGELQVIRDVSFNSRLYAVDASFRGDVEIERNLEVNKIIVGKDDVSFNRRLKVVDASFHNDVYINNELIVNGDVSFNNELIVNGDVSFNKGLSCVDASFHNNVDIIGKFKVMNDASFNNNITARDASFHDDVDIYGGLIVTKDVSFNSKLTGTDASFHGDVEIDTKLLVFGDASFNSKLLGVDASFSGDVEILQKLTVFNDVSFNNDFTAVDASFHGDVDVYNKLVVKDDVSFNKKLSGVDASFQSDVDIYRKLFVDDDVSFNANLSGVDASFHGSVDIHHKLVVSNDASFNMSITGMDASFHRDVDIHHKLLVKDDVSLNKSLSVVDASFHHNVDIYHRLYVSDDVSLNKGLSVASDTSLNAHLTVIGDVSFNRNLSAYDASFHDAVDIVGKLTALDDVSFNKYLSALDASFHNDVDIVGNLLVNDDVSFNKSLGAVDASFQRDVDIFHKLNVYDDASFGGRITGVDASFTRDVEIDNMLVVHRDASFNTHISSLDASFQRDVDIYNKLFVVGDVSFDTHLSVLDASFQRDVNIMGELVVDKDASFNKSLRGTDASFENNVEIASNLLVRGDVSINTILRANDLSVGTIYALNNREILIEDDLSLNAKVSGTDASFNNIQVHKLFGNSPIEIEDDVSFNGDISCNNIVFTGTIFNSDGTEIGPTLDIALINDTNLEEQYSKISWLRFDKNSHFNLDDGDEVDSSFLNITIEHQSDISYNTIAPVTGNTTTFTNDISVNGKIIGDISSNEVYDLSVNFHDLSGKYYTLSGDLDDFKNNVKTSDLSVNRIGANSGSIIEFESDVSFKHAVNIKGDLTIDGSFNFNEVIQNITTVNNELVISTQLDISNQGTGHALEVAQWGAGDNNDVALFNAGSEGDAFEIKSDGKAIFYKDVSFNKKIIGDISSDEFYDLSKNFYDLSRTYYELSGVVTKNVVDISDMSGLVFDLSDNFHDLSGKYYTLSGELDDFMNNVQTTDASIDVIMANTANNIVFNSDVSFHHSVDVSDTITTATIVGSTTYTNPLYEEFNVTVNASQFVLNGINRPNLTLYKDSIYHFDLTNQTNNTNELLFSEYPDGRFGPGDMGMHHMFSGQQHTGIGQSYKSIVLNLAGDFNTSLIGCEVYVYFRYDTSNGSDLGDLQIKHINVGGSNIDKDNTWQTTVNTSNSIYEHNNSSWTNISEGQSSGRWNIQASGDNATDTGSTGLQNSVGSIYYEDTGDVDNTFVYLRSELIEISVNTIDVEYGAYGANIGSLYYGIYVETPINKPYTSGIVKTGTLAGNDLNYTWLIENDTPDTIYYSGDVSRNMGGTITIQDVFTKDKLVIDSETEISGNLTLKSDVSFNSNVDIVGNVNVSGLFVIDNDISINGKILGDISNLSFHDLSINFHDLSATYYDLSDLVAGHVVDISDISGLVFDLSKNFHDLSATYYDLSDLVAEHVVDISDISGLVFDLSKNFHDLSGTYYDLSDLVAGHVVDISDISGLVFDISKNFHDLSATYYDLSDLVAEHVVDISDISGLVFDLSKNFHDLSGTYYDLSDLVAEHVVDISDISGLVFDLSKNFHDLSATYYDLSDLVARHVVDISDISGLVFDLSKNFHDLSGTYYELSNNFDAFKTNVKTNDLSVNNISVNSGSNIRFLSDVSFNETVQIKGDLIIDGSFNFNEIIRNTTTVNNELLISTQVDISNHGTGPALSVTQYGDGVNDNLVLLHAGTDGSAVEIKGDGRTIFYKDVSFNQKIIGDISSDEFYELSKNFYDLSGTYYDLSDLVAGHVIDISDISGLVFDLSKNFHDLSDTYYDLSGLVTINISDISDISYGLDDLSGKFYTLSGDYDAFKDNVKSTDASFNTIGDLDSGKIVFSSDVSFNGNIDAGDASFGVISVTHIKGYSPIAILDDIVLHNKHLTAPDASFDSIGAIDGSLILIGDLSVNGQIFTSGGLVGAGGGSGTDASFNVIDEFLDGSGVTFLTDVSFNETIDVSNSIITKKIFGSTIDNVLSSENVEYTITVDQNRFKFDSAIQPSLNLYRGSTYKFDQSSSDNSGQRLFVSNDLSGRLIANGSNQLIDTGSAYATYHSEDAYTENNYPEDKVYDKVISPTGSGSIWHSKRFIVDTSDDNEFVNNSGFTYLNQQKPYVGLEFNNSNSHKVTKYRIWPRGGITNLTAYWNSRPKGWKLYGATSKVDFDIGGGVVIDSVILPGTDGSVVWGEQGDESNPLPRNYPDASGYQERVVTQPDYYNYYVFSFTHAYDIVVEDGQDKSNIVITEIALYTDEQTTSFSENTAGFTSTGTLGTDLVSTWTIPTDASDTMYYASDGSANAGGIINITDFTESASDNKLLIETNTDISGKLVVNDDLSVNGSIFFSNNLYQNGELFSGSNTSDASFNVIQEFMDGSGITFLSDVSFNTRLTVPDASFNNIGAIDGSLIIVGDLSVNGQIFTSGGLVGAGGGSGTDASFNVIDEFLDGSGVTFLTDVSVNARLTVPDICVNRIAPIDGSLVFTDDISVNGNIYFTDSLYQNGVLFESGIVGPTGPTGSAEINMFTIFDNSNAAGTIAGLTGPTGATPWINSFPTELKAGTVLFHNIKASGYIAPHTNFTWPEDPHSWILQRSKADAPNTYQWDGVAQNVDFKHTFNRLGEHEEATYSMTETIPNDVSYANWRVDFSGAGGRNNVDDKLTWTITKVHTNQYFSSQITSTSNISVNHITSNGVLTGENATLKTISVSDGSLIIMGDISVNGNIFSSGGLVGGGGSGGGGGGGGSGTDASFDRISEYTSSAGTTFTNTIDVTGKVRATDDVISFYSSSDRRLKTNIRTIDNASEILDSMRGVRFNWNSTAHELNNNLDLSKGEIGVIAQEIEEVLPEVIKEGLQNFKAVRYENIVAVLIEGIHELQNRVNILENEVNLLKNK